MGIVIDGGPLYQWDTGRTATVTTEGATEAHLVLSVFDIS